MRSPMRTLQIFAHPKGDSWDEIRTSVSTANGLQSHFKCSLSELTTPLSSTPTIADLDAYESQLSKSTPPLSGLVVCEERFHESVLVHELLPKRIYVSCRVKKGLSAPPFRLYLLYQIAAAALTLGARLRSETNEAMIHRPPVGCLWDWWKGAGQRATAMMIARICPQCQQALRTHGDLPPESIVAAQQILEYVRRSMLGESPTVANRVFIAYGRGEDWLSLKDLVERWGLEVEHFNREAVAGVLVAERWRQMLDRSRFAFAVMTPGDELADGRRQARQNVVHEIGLCHARIGLRSTAILLAEGTETFSNVDGVNYISFTSGNLQASAGRIRQLLTERGFSRSTISGRKRNPTGKAAAVPIAVTGAGTQRSFGRPCFLNR